MKKHSLEWDRLKGVLGGHAQGHIFKCLQSLERNLCGICSGGRMWSRDEGHDRCTLGTERRMAPSRSVVDWMHEALALGWASPC